MTSRLPLFFLGLLLPTLCLAFSPDEFRKVAHEMIADLKKSYGVKFIHREVTFDTGEFTNLVNRTQLDPVAEPLENIYFEKLNQKSITEKVDAVNYFPKVERIEYYERVFDSLYKSKKIEELKILIYHEFVPYFTKSADRNREFDTPLRAIYKKSYSFKDIKTGLYYAVRVNDPFADLLNAHILLSIVYEPQTNTLMINQVENSLSHRWCLDCYDIPTLNFTPETPNDFVSKIESKSTDHPVNQLLPEISSSDDLNGRGFGYAQIFNSETIGLGIMEEDFNGTLRQYVANKGRSGKLIIFSRIKNANELNWDQPKKFPLVNFLFSQKDARCAVSSESLEKDLLDRCHEIALTEKLNPKLNLGEIKISSQDCRPENIKNYDLIKSYTHFKCAKLSILELQTPADYYPLGEKKHRDMIAFWNRLKAMHIQFDQIFSQFPDAFK